MRALAIALIILISCFAVPQAVSAQDTPSVEVAGGYSFLRDYHVKENFPAAWFASGAWNLNSWLGVVGELGGSYKTYDFSVNPTTEDLKQSTTSWSTTTRLHTLLVGPRHFHQMGGSNMFVQVLAGPAWESGGVNVFRDSVASKDPKLTVQPGAGIDIPLSGRLKARVGADYRRIFADRSSSSDKNNNEFRFTAGLAAGF